MILATEYQGKKEMCPFSIARLNPSSFTPFSRPLTLPIAWSFPAAEAVGVLERMPFRACPYHHVLPNPRSRGVSSFRQTPSLLTMRLYTEGGSGPSRAKINRDACAC
jgi:hypothetical protein